MADNDPSWEPPPARRSRRVPPVVLLVAVVVVGLLAGRATGGGGDRELAVEVDTTPSPTAAPTPSPSAAPTPAAPTPTPDSTVAWSLRWRTLPAAPITAREYHTAVWTGREMLVWGGSSITADGDSVAKADGAAFSPRSGRWRRLPPAPIGGRFGHIGVWTGEEMLVWGGADHSETAPVTGAAFNPDTGRWRTTAPAPIQGRSNHVAVWTGKELLVWGGTFRDVFGDGAAYDPATDRWRRLPRGPLAERFGATAVWTGEEMLVWGGATHTLDYDAGPKGAAYDPVADRWRRLPPSPLRGRADHIAAWTGREMVLWGGSALGFGGQVFGDGAAFDPVSDRWRSLPRGAPTPRFGHSAVWTGAQVLVWGGVNRTFTDDGGAYDPRRDRWTPIAPAPVEGPSRYPAVWTGDQDEGLMLLWGGSVTPSGAAYRAPGPARLRGLRGIFTR